MQVLEWIYKHITFRRLVVLWGCCMITIAIMRATRPEVMVEMTTPAATVVTGVIGILATALKFYTDKRKRDGTE